MARTVGQLIEGRTLLTVQADAPIREVVALMVNNEFSQLPVVDADGQFVGLFTERKLTRAVLDGIGCDIIDLSAAAWMEPPSRIVSPQRDVYEVMRLLTDTYAVVVGVNNQPIGIVTDYDVATFLSEWSEGIALVENIERTLRHYIESEFSTPEALTAALIRVFHADKVDPSRPRKSFEELSLDEELQFIENEDHWARFQQYFRSSTVFHKVLHKSRQIRNQIVHFRSPVTNAQLGTLRDAKGFLDHCPQPLWSSRQ